MGEVKDRKIYYSMGEVAEMFDVNQSLIRFWEQKFDILKPHKNKKGNRMFTPQDVDNLKLIYHLVKEKGMTLAGAQKRIKDNREGIGRDMEIIDRLLSVRAMLLEIRQEIKEGKGIGDACADEDYLMSLPAGGRMVADAAVIEEDIVAKAVVTEAAVPRARGTAAEKNDVPSKHKMAAQSASAADNGESDVMGPQPRIIEQTLF